MTLQPLAELLPAVVAQLSHHNPGRTPPMPKYRKRPVVIEARQWDGTAESASPIIDWILTGEHCARYHDEADDAPAARTEIAIDTLEGTVTAAPGDWIIRDAQGEFHPCKPDIFEATYEPAEDQS